MGLFRRHSERVRAHARILVMAPTPSGARRTGALDVEHDFRLGVTLPDGGSFEADHTCKVPHAKAPALGQIVPVDVVPDEQTVIRIAFADTPDVADRARNAAAAAQAGDNAAASDAMGFRLRDG